MRTDNAIVGVNFTKLDTPVIKYTDFLSTKVPINTVNNLFVFAARDAYRALKDDKGETEAKKMIKAIIKNMDETFTPQYEHVKNVKNHAEAGIFIQRLYHFFNITDTDLIIMGKKKGSHGTINKSVIRHIPANTLIIPEKSERKLDKIVISLDLADKSENNLKKALDFCALVSGSPEITVLHIGKVLKISEIAAILGESNELGVNEFKKFFKDYNNDVKNNFKNFIKNFRKKYQVPDFKVKVIGETGKPYHGLMNYIKQGKTDLVIMGTKSHSLFDAILLGSFAEKIIDKNDIVPMLVIR